MTATSSTENKSKVHKKTTEKSEAVKLLRTMFDSGQISHKPNPSTVYQSISVFFSNHRLDLLGTRLNSLKQEYKDLQSTFSLHFLLNHILF